MQIRGHAIELRVCAEDPANGFLPDIGRVEEYSIPKGPGIRVDDAMEAGLEIPVYYDNMIAKLIVWADSREEAMDRMQRAIGEYRLKGIASTLPFGRFVLAHQAFREGNFDTSFIDRYFSAGELYLPLTEAEETAAAMAAVLVWSEGSRMQALPAAAQKANWQNARKQLR